MTRWFYLAVALTVVAFGASLYVHQFHYDDLPDRVPTHWDIHFRPDGFTPKENILGVFLAVPLGMAAFCLLTLVLPWLSPRHFEVESFRSTYGYVMFLVVALFAYIHVAILWGALASEGHNVLFMRLFLGGMCLFFALMGNVMGKVRRNFWMGVRTPWTLASEAVWDRTHRLAAWLFVAAGVGGFLTVLVIPEALAAVAAVVMFVGIMLAALVPVGYSLWLYKRLEREGRLEPPAESNREVPVG